jgi:hypothetical protein
LPENNNGKLRGMHCSAFSLFDIIEKGIAIDLWDERVNYVAVLIPELPRLYYLLKSETALLWKINTWHDYSSFCVSSTFKDHK